MIIAVDYDDTLVHGNHVNLMLINVLKNHQRNGHVVILWTCREGKSLADALQTLYKNGFRPDLVNRNHPSAIQKMGHDSRKILADVYIDDKNEVVRFYGNC